jgi:hypothetical protein
MGGRKSSMAALAVGLLTTASPLSARQEPDRAAVASAVTETNSEKPVPTLAWIPESAPAPRLVAPLFSVSTRPATAVGSPLSSLRDQAIEHTDAYYTRLTIHRWGSYVMLPLFAGEYVLGNELLNGANPAGWVRPMHGVGAGALGVLFGVNTITGVWNLVESRKDPGAVRRILHSTLMLAADAGFLYTS